MGACDDGFPVWITTEFQWIGIWVIVDKLTKTTRFLAIKVMFTLDKLAKLYVDKIVRQYGAPVSIDLVRDPRFTSNF